MTAWTSRLTESGPTIPRAHSDPITESHLSEDALEGRGSQGRDHVISLKAGDFQGLHPRGLARNNPHLGFRPTQGPGDEDDQGGVGRAIGRRRGDPRLQIGPARGVLVPAINGIAPAPGGQANDKPLTSAQSRGRKIRGSRLCWAA